MTSGVAELVQAGLAGLEQPFFALAACLMNPFIAPLLMSAAALLTLCGPPPLTSAVS